ncbi:MAG: adenylate/guanylate cyclase domain-containing protein [Bacteroidota bacterium]
MKKLILGLLLLVFSFVGMENIFASNYLLTKDSLQDYPNIIDKNWKFYAGVDTTMAAQSFNDSQWMNVKTFLRWSDTMHTTFSGIGWFRLHITADTSVAGVPLAMSITHFGASEIYLDGKRLKSFGKIRDADSTEYYDPRDVPFIFTIEETGEHVLAVRYANYNAAENFKTFGQSRGGFELMIGQADNFIASKNERSTILSFFLMLLAGIFIAICVIHLFLFIYHRADWSNLYFSFFMFCVGFLFIIGFIGYTSSDPSFAIKAIFLTQPVIVIACISLSGFIRELFAKRKWRFAFIITLGIVSFLLRFYNLPLASILTAALLVIVSFEAVFTIIFGMIKRVKGARIIGTGILFFAFFILTIFTMAIANGGNFDINDTTLTGKILELFLVLSILSIPVSMSLYQAWRFASINKDLGLQLSQVKVLSKKSLEQEQEKKKILETQKEKLEEEVIIRTSELMSEKKKSDDLLLNILPSEVAEELKAKGTAAAKQFDEVTVLFTDFKNFTSVSERLTAQELVNEINYCYSEFDKIISKYGIEKIKTIGDAYMCAGGLPVANKTNAEDTVKAGLDILDFMLNENELRTANGKTFFEIRIGIHTGPVVAGIVGIKKFAYDIWGDTVNIASRMESAGEAGKVNISGGTYALVKDKFSCVHRGKIEAKNKGMIDMFFISRRDYA